MKDFLQFLKRERFIFFWLIVIAGVVSVSILLSFAFYESAVEAVEKEVRKELLIMAMQTSNSIENFIQAAITDLSWLSELSYIKKIKEPETSKFLNRLRERKRFFYVIFRLDRNGRCTYVNPKNALPGVIGKDFSFREYFKQAKRTGEPVVSGLLVSGYYKNVKNKYKAVVVAVPIFDKYGRFDGVIGTDIKVSDLARRFILPIRIGKDGYAWMLDGRGVTLVHPDPKNIGKNVITGNVSKDLAHLVESALLTKTPGTGSYTYKGVKKLVSFAPVRFDGHVWLVAISIPYKDVHHLVYPMYVRLLGLMIFVVIVTVVGGLLFIKKTREVRKLKEKMVELEIRIDEDRKKKEVEEITRTDYFKTLMEKAEEFKSSIKK